MKAEALQIVTTGEGHTFVLDEDTLTEVLLQNDIKDRFVVIVSVAGAFRKGKSFILDFFLRYMYSKVFLTKVLVFIRFINIFIFVCSIITIIKDQTIGWALTQNRCLVSLGAAVPSVTRPVF